MQNESRVSNNTNIAIALAVWLAHDEYDYRPDDKSISATSLLKPTREIVLASRIEEKDQTPEDIINLVASRIGTAVHNSIENSWATNYENSFKRLGIPKKISDRILINPKPEDIKPDSLPVYMERREEKMINGFTISGQYDFIIEDEVQDFKNTSTFTYTNKTKDKDYSLQGSIYRWLNPDIIKKDTINIHFIFSDWKAFEAKNPAYPPNKAHSKRYPLLSIEKTEQFITEKTNEIMKYMDAPQEDLPECSKKELWQDDSVFKYYKNPAKKTRSTANFKTIQEASLRMTKDGNVGEIVEVPGKVKACKYCSAAPICKQKDKYILDGSLTM